MHIELFPQIDQRGRKKMFRVISTRLFKNAGRLVRGEIKGNDGGVAFVSKTPRHEHETDDEYDDRMECYFSRHDIDDWELRKGLTDLAGMDAVPEPRVLIAALCACRRVSDYALAVRVLEMVKFKCGPKVDKIYPYIMQELQPVLKELGIDTLDVMGYDKPELAVKDIYEM